MIYEEYRKASQRHYHTCDFLLKQIKDPYNTIDKNLQNRILVNIYYLSGYIIECGLSYAFFKAINYDVTKSVYDLQKWTSYNRSQYITKHGYQSNDSKIQVILQKGGSNASKLDKITKLNKNDLPYQMYAAWDAKVRYTVQDLAFDLNPNNVEVFLKLAQEIQTITRKI